MHCTDEKIMHGVVAQFSELCRCPHPSWGEKPAADFLETLLKKRGFSVRRDKWNNIAADLPAVPGREEAPLTVLQGHLDMVCAVRPGSGYDPAHSPVVPVISRGMLCSDGNSSLGADNNLGNAAVLWLLDQTIPHGPLRLLFTVAEEVGLQGAQQVQPEWLAGARYLINTDGFLLGTAIVGSAGGLRENFSGTVALVPRKNEEVYELGLSGFPGGHSGYDIHRGRPNPIRLAAQFLRELKEYLPYELLHFSGGHAYNAIPMDCTVMLAVPRAAAEVLLERVELFAADCTQGSVTVKNAAWEGGAWKDEMSDRFLRVLTDLDVGVYSWRDQSRGQVRTSANLGCIRQRGEELELNCFVRYGEAEEARHLSERHCRNMSQLGLTCRTEEYPSWPERDENPLADAMNRVWMGLTGREMTTQTVHVGLEPAVLGAKAPGMIMVSTGPEILDPHSLTERAPLAGLPRYVRLLAGTLDEISR